MDFCNGKIWAQGMGLSLVHTPEMGYLQWGKHCTPSECIGVSERVTSALCESCDPKAGEAERCWLLQRSSEGSLRLPASNGKVPSAGKRQTGPGKALSDYTEPALSQRKGLIARCLGKCHRVYTRVTSCIYGEKRCWQLCLLFITLLKACLGTGRRAQLLSEFLLLKLAPCLAPEMGPRR